MYLRSASTAERKAPGQSERLVGTLTTIDGLSRRATRVAHNQAPPATATGYQPSQQRTPTAPRLHTSHLGVIVDGELLLVPLELRPVNVAVMVILQQNLPLLKRLAVAVALAGPSVDDLGALLAFAVGVAPA